VGERGISSSEDSGISYSSREPGAIAGIADYNIHMVPPNDAY
jgi:hypothetical protein